MTTTAPAPRTQTRTTERSLFRPTLRSLFVAAATVTVGALAAVAVPAVAMANEGPALPGGPTFQGPPTTPPPPEPPEPQVNPDVVPDADDLTPATTVPEPPFPPQPPDPEVNPDVQPDIDDFTPATTVPEPPLPPEPPEPPVGEDDEIAPNPAEDCEPFDPAYPVVDISDDDTSSTVELSLQGDDQLQLCVTPLVVATYALSEPAFGGDAELLGHQVLSSEDLDDWLLTGEPVTVTLPLDGCYHATVVFWGVGIPLALDGVAEPPHVLTSAIGGDGRGDGCAEPGGDPGGRLPETGAAVLAGIWLAAGLIGAGSVVWLVAAKRRRPAD